MARDTSAARRLWQAIEPVHAVVYFAPEPADACVTLGLKGWWMGYFAGRFGVLGAVGPAPVTAMAFGFAPAMVARALPDAWTYASPEAVVAARFDAIAAALRRVLPSDTDVDEVSALLWRAVDGCDVGGRPLAAAWAAADPPADPLARLWLATAILREHRGDGHVIAAVAHGLTGLENNVMGATDREWMLKARGWTAHEWDAAAARVATRPPRVREAVEAMTDELAMGPVDTLGADGIERVTELAIPLARHVIDAGVVPVPNPIGVGRP
ncbi:MAG TPA: hypothetical protein VFK42_09440 [Acidimicrobiales bacterium]|nr:hypothetical protein [Acidimicrobiales bacterium]